MSSSNSTVDLNTLNLLTPTHDCEPVELNQDNKQNKANGQSVSDIEIISEAEAQELRRLETTVERGLRAFWEIGQALRQIQDQRLYRQDYKNFEEYCITRWEMSRRSAYQLIEAASVYENVRHGAQILPANERQTRPLTILPPEKQREAWNKAVSTAPSGKVTSVHVAQVAKEYQQGSVVTKSRKKKTPNQQQLSNNSTKSVGRSCWNCAHCSREFVDDPQSFYCYQLGKLSFIEKDGNQRAAECEFWTHRWAESDEINKSRPPLQETFNLTLQLPAYLQPLIQDAAKESGLVVVDWVAKVLKAAVLKKETSPNSQIHQNIIDVQVSEIT
ncbi:MAG: hypothetical protein KME54_24570 [Tolypothrix brevis GSE-NOS-MK-07-07A]|jgi:hypothetical protein|nr:hypothetical protein [Tolypothrix brevis GSE-NOS-MK-07-07A]